MKKYFLTTMIIFAFSLSGWSQWTSDVMKNTSLSNNTSEKFSMVFAPGLNGQIYIAWLEANPFITVKMQLINADGTLSWDASGLTISTSFENENPGSLNLVSCDVDGSAHIVWQDSKSGINGLYASKISPSGNFLWGSEGVNLYQTASCDLVNTSICLCHTGCLFIATELISIAGNEKNKIVLQKIGNDGTISLENPVMIDDIIFSCGKPKLVSSGCDGCMIAFTKSTDTIVHGIVNLWVQKIDGNGNKMFGEGKVIYNLGFMTPWQRYDAISGGKDDMLIAWHNYQYDSPKPEAHLQHISSEGVISWQKNGILLSSEPNIYSDYPMIAGTNQNGEIIVFWKHSAILNSMPITSEIYAQKISSSGERLWTDFGKQIISNPDSITTFKIDDAFISNNLSFLIYDRTRVENVALMWNKIFAAGIDNNGNSLWQDTSITLSIPNTSKSDIASTSFVNNQSVVCWVETDTLWNSTIKGQNFRIDGTLDIEEIIHQNSDVVLLPNPVNDILTFLSKSPLVSVSVYDIYGKRLLTERNNSINRINLSQLNPGVYFVEYMTILGKFGTKKMIKY